MSQRTDPVCSCCGTQLRDRSGSPVGGCDCPRGRCGGCGGCPAHCDGSMDCEDPRDPPLPALVARMPGSRCRACGEEIEVGDEIHPAGEAGEGWIHATCEEDWE